VAGRPVETLTCLAVTALGLPFYRAFGGHRPAPA
jgi:hypothetical protein